MKQDSLSSSLLLYAPSFFRHSSPLATGSGLLHSRFLCLTPVPQVCEQLVHVDQTAQLPFTEI